MIIVSNAELHLPVCTISREQEGPVPRVLSTIVNFEVVPPVERIIK